MQTALKHHSPFTSDTWHGCDILQQQQKYTAVYYDKAPYYRITAIQSVYFH